VDKPLIAVSIGDPNGVGPQIALLAHRELVKFCQPLYFVSADMIAQAAELAGLEVPTDFETEYVGGEYTIHPGKVSKKGGAYSFRSFQKAVEMTANGICEALVTLPVHKKAWQKAGIPYSGHTDYLRQRFGREAIMMLGSEELFVSLYTDHIPLRKVPEAIKPKRLARFLQRLYESLEPKEALVLGLNPHAGDGGVLGDEEKKIKKAIKTANDAIGKEVFAGPGVPDVAFTPKMRQRYRHIVALYHDQGLAPLKALYFDEAINVSLGLPIIRTSPDHGTAFDIAYKETPSLKSYINAARYAAKAATSQDAS